MLADVTGTPVAVKFLWKNLSRLFILLIQGSMVAQWVELFPENFSVEASSLVSALCVKFACSPCVMGLPPALQRHAVNWQLRGAFCVPTSLYWHPVALSWSWMMDGHSCLWISMLCGIYYCLHVFIPGHTHTWPGFFVRCPSTISAPHTPTLSLVGAHIVLNNPGPGMLLASLCPFFVLSNVQYSCVCQWRCRSLGHGQRTHCICPVPKSD